MKISVITLHAVRNYGSALQTYATQKVFKDLGHDVEIVDYRREALALDSIYKILTNKQFGLVMKIKLCMILPSTKKINKVFEKFLQDNINLTKNVYVSDSDFERNPIEADIYCTGSDQVWNSGWHNGIPKPFFLSFVPEGKKKIAYSASFGKTELDEWEKEPIKELLDSYDYISVREASGVKILNALGFNDAVHILDPTMVVSPKTWYRMSEENIIGEKYILVYQLCNNKKFDIYAQELAKKKGIKLIRMCTRYDQARKTGKAVVIPEIEHFLSLIRHAECVITDSFHATAFSITFHKQFIDIYPDKYGSRLDSILNLTDLQDRQLTDFNNYEVADKSIDYEKVDKILDEKRKEAMDFLKRATNE